MVEKPMVEKPMVEKPMVEKPMVEKPMVEKPPAVLGDFYFYRDADHLLRVVRVVGWNATSIFFQRVAICPHREGDAAAKIPFTNDDPFSKPDAPYALNQEWLNRNRAVKFVTQLPDARLMAINFSAGLSFYDHALALSSSLVQTLTSFPVVLLHIVIGYAAFAAADLTSDLPRLDWIRWSERERTTRDHPLLFNEVLLALRPPFRSARRFSPSKPTPLRLQHTGSFQYTDSERGRGLSSTLVHLPNLACMVEPPGLT
jgi:hypothetical protein